MRNIIIPFLLLLSINAIGGPHSITLNVVSGHIDNYDHAQADYGAHGGDTLLVPGGTYAYISLGGIHAPAGKDSAIYIMNTGGVAIVNGGSIFTHNTTNVKWLGKDPTADYGFEILNCGFRSINIVDTFSNCEMSGFYIKNNLDYVIFSIQTRPWTGLIDDANHDNIFHHFKIQNTADGWWRGDPSDGIGFWVNTESYDFILDSMQESTFWHANDCFFEKAHDNVLTNLALSDSTDAGVMDIHGSLDFYNNFCNHFSGSIVRGHLLSLVASKTERTITSHIFNNVWRNASKYGGPQINTLASDTVFSYIRPGGIIVAFNSASKCQDRSYKSGPPFQGGAAFFDWYWCWGDTAKVEYNAYDSMHYDNGQNLITSYLFHNGTGQPLPDTIGNIRVIDPRVTYADTLHNVPFKVCELTGKAIGQLYAALAYNNVARQQGKPCFVGAYNLLNNTMWIFKNKKILKSQ